MDETTLRRVHLALWKAWRVYPNGPLDEERTYHSVIEATGLDVLVVAEALKELEREGSVRVHWNRDFPWYNVIRDELGFDAKKDARIYKHQE